IWISTALFSSTYAYFRMGSEASSKSSIFFKDKKNELKGPFTERQVQEWYRQKWFDGSFPFCFLREGEKPRDDTPFHTL
ncbi:hypothetical protein PMAYCL1PPCAC_00551, partial [Pristionchus mayeri]